MPVPQKQIAQRYDVIQKLSSGSFGTTYVVQDKTDLRQYVLKKVTCATKEDAFDALKEVQWPLIC
jgi:serine/threonine protein kinase